MFFFLKFIHVFNFKKILNFISVIGRTSLTIISQMRDAGDD